jgi:ABC-type sugar transport system substrate-binding protein
MDAVVGLFLNASGDYHGSIVREVEAAAAEANIEVQVFDAENTAAKQAQDLVRFGHEHAGRRACVLVVPQRDPVDVGAIESDATFRLAGRVMAAGVGWITINHGREDMIPPLHAEFPGVPAALVAVDNVDFGRMQARQLRCLLPYGGTALLVRGDPSDSACRGRSSGLTDELRQSRIVIEEVDGRWETEVAEPAVYRWMASPLHGGKVAAVVGQNDHMALGARRALVRAASDLRRPELAAVPVLGGDGIAQYGRLWVDEGTLTSTVQATLPGRPAIEQLARFWRQGTALPPVTRLRVTSYPPLDRLVPVRT